MKGLREKSLKWVVAFKKLKKKKSFFFLIVGFNIKSWYSSYLVGRVKWWEVCLKCLVPNFKRDWKVNMWNNWDINCNVNCLTTSITLFFKPFQSLYFVFPIFHYKYLWLLLSKSQNLHYGDFILFIFFWKGNREIIDFFGVTKLIIIWYIIPHNIGTRFKPSANN